MNGLFGGTSILGTLASCAGAGYHYPGYSSTEAHHVHPKEWCTDLGLPIDPQTVEVCGTCHNTLTLALSQMRKQSGSWAPLRPTLKQQALLHDAWSWWVNHGGT